MKSDIINCENCGHCIDIKTPKETDDPEITRIRENVANSVISWIKNMPAGQDEREVGFMQ